MSIAQMVLNAASELRDTSAGLSFGPPVVHVYNPLQYAWSPHEDYVRKWGNTTKRVVFLGMNPGPWGMAQVGVPFGEISYVRDWLTVTGDVGKPAGEHPKRPVDGFACKRSEVSGKRLWGLFAERSVTAEVFFEDHFVANYCPLMFSEAGGRNRTPDKLPATERGPLFDVCDTHLQQLVEILQPEWVIGIGRFACDRAESAFADTDVRVGRILHPSPASPAANRDWSGVVERQLTDLGIWR